MARLYVVADPGLDRARRHCSAEIVTDDNGAVAWTRCGETLSDRGHFEDTIQAAQVHVDQCERPSA